MRSLDSKTLSALARRELVGRDFFTIKAKDRITGLPVYGYYWNDIGTITANVIDGTTFQTVSRTFTGTAGLIAHRGIPLTNDLSVRTVSVILNNVSDEIDDLVRGYDLKAAPVEIHGGLFNPDTWTLDGPAFVRFVGFVNTCRINTGAAGKVGSLELSLVSHTRELTRSGTAKRSEASQQRRLSTDAFHRYVGIVPEVQIFWGQQRGNVPAAYVTGSYVGGGGIANTIIGRIFGLGG